MLFLLCFHVGWLVCIIRLADVWTLHLPLTVTEVSPPPLADAIHGCSPVAPACTVMVWSERTPFANVAKNVIRV